MAAYKYQPLSAITDPVEPHALRTSVNITLEILLGTSYSIKTKILGKVVYLRYLSQKPLRNSPPNTLLHPNKTSSNAFYQIYPHFFTPLSFASRTLLALRYLCFRTFCSHPLTSSTCFRPALLTTSSSSRQRPIPVVCVSKFPWKLCGCSNVERYQLFQL